MRLCLHLDQLDLILNFFLKLEHKLNFFLNLIKFLNFKKLFKSLI